MPNFFFHTARRHGSTLQRLQSSQRNLDLLQALLRLIVIVDFFFRLRKSTAVTRPLRVRNSSNITRTTTATLSRNSATSSSKVSFLLVQSFLSRHVGFTDKLQENKEFVSAYDGLAGNIATVRRANVILLSIFLNDPKVMLISGDWNATVMAKGDGSFQGMICLISFFCPVIRSLCF